MDYPNHTTNHEKGKHLTYEDYVVIELRLKDGWTPNAIAKKELHCAANTVRNIIKKMSTVRIMQCERGSRVTAGHKVTVQYIIGLTV